MPLSQKQIDAPTLADFDITEASVSSSFETISQVEDRFSMLMWTLHVTVFLCTCYFLITSEMPLYAALGASLLLGLFLAGLTVIFVGGLLFSVLPRIIPSYAQAKHVVERDHQFRNTLKAYEKEQRKRQVDYWVNLSPYEFEHEVASVFRRLGMSARVTAQSGDKGIDIHITSDEVRAIVQCKQYQNPATPALVRELYGALIADGADLAMLVCTGGFTSGVHEFADGKNIHLIDLNGLLRLVEISSHRKSVDARIGFAEVFATE